MKHKLTPLILLGLSLGLAGARAQSEALAPEQQATPVAVSEPVAATATQPTTETVDLLANTPEVTAASVTDLVEQRQRELAAAPNPELVAQATPAPVASATVATEVAASKSASGDGSASAAHDAGEVLPLIMFEDAPLNDAIKTLARQAGINFQFDPRVASPAPGPDGQVAPQATVSIRFENITAQQALEAVLANHSLVLVGDPKTKTYRVTIKDPAAPDPLVTRVIQLKYTSPANMALIIKPILSSRSSVTADGRTSKLIMVATERELIATEALIEDLDAPTKQVLIEARILETSMSPSTIKGIDWSGTLQAQNFSFGNNTPDAQEFKPGTPATPSPDGITPGTPATPGQQAVFGRIFDSGPKLAINTASGFYPPVGFLNADGVSAVLSFLNTDSDTEVVATPRAVTLDNEKAVLSVTRAFPIFQITPGSANSPAGASILYTNLGTILEVTPRISANNSIALKVVPEVSNIDSKDSQTVSGLVNTANVYAIRRIEANVVVPSGNTLVMGGLVSDTKTKLYTKVPILGDLPGMGLLFRRDSKSRNKANLIIFVTPTIVEDRDFHPTASDFLQNRIEERPDKEESAWDSGKPHKWTRKTASN